MALASALLQNVRKQISASSHVVLVHSFVDDIPSTLYEIFLHEFDISIPKTEERNIILRDLTYSELDLTEVAKQCIGRDVDQLEALVRVYFLTGFRLYLANEMM